MRLVVFSVFSIIYNVVIPLYSISVDFKEKHNLLQPTTFSNLNTTPTNNTTLVDIRLLPSNQTTSLSFSETTANSDCLNHAVSFQCLAIRSQMYLMEQMTGIEFTLEAESIPVRLFKYFLLLCFGPKWKRQIQAPNAPNGQDSGDKGAEDHEIKAQEAEEESRKIPYDKLISEIEYRERKLRRPLTDKELSILERLSGHTIPRREQKA